MCLITSQTKPRRVFFPKIVFKSVNVYDFVYNGKKYRKIRSSIWGYTYKPWKRNPKEILKDSCKVKKNTMIIEEGYHFYTNRKYAKNWMRLNSLASNPVIVKCLLLPGNRYYLDQSTSEGVANRIIVTNLFLKYNRKS